MGAMDQYPEYGDSDFKISGAVAPTDDPRLKQIQGTQQAAAKNFRQNIPNYSDTLYNSYAGQAKAGLAKNIQNTRANYNSRGLLRSGMRQGAELGQQANTANDLVNARGQINQGLLSTADQMDTNSFNTSGAIAGMGANLGGSALGGLSNDIQQNNANSQATAGIVGGIGSGIGNGIGTYLGYKSSY